MFFFLFVVYTSCVECSLSGGEEGGSPLLCEEWDTFYAPFGTTSPMKDGYICWDIPHWSTHACHGHGSCISENRCQCQQPFRGKNCTLLPPEYEGFMCNGLEPTMLGACGFMVKEIAVIHGGLCVGPDTCECYPSFGGSFCNEI